MSLSMSERGATKGKSQGGRYFGQSDLCPICGASDWRFVRCYNTLDKYEENVGIGAPVQRVWSKCRCGFLKCTRNYDLRELDGIYDNGYRAKGFREDSVADTFNKIVSLPFEKSENKQRIAWLLNTLGGDVGGEILDVGAGLCVFLYELCAGSAGIWKPRAFEPNAISAHFISEELKIPVYPMRYWPGLKRGGYDVVSCIHTLEHMEAPEDFLLNVREQDLKSGGRLFLEVPDAVEFEYLPHNHDEFNSCHLCFYTGETLYRLVESAGYKVTDLNRSFHEERSLSRIRLLARA